MTNDFVLRVKPLNCVVIHLNTELKDSYSEVMLDLVLVLQLYYPEMYCSRFSDDNHIKIPLADCGLKVLQMHFKVCGNA